MGNDDDIRTYYDRQFIQALDLQGRDVTITIAGVRKEKIRGNQGDGPKSKAILKIKGKDMEFIPCKTDATQTIASMYGTKTKDWIGKRITIFPTTCQAFGKTVECIRVRPRRPDDAAARTGAQPPPDETPPGLDPMGDDAGGA